MLNVFKLLYSGSQPFKDKAVFLQCARNYELFDVNDLEQESVVLCKIKELLDSEDKTRFEGYLLLHTVILQCSDKTFTLNASLWLKVSLNTLKGNDGKASKELACAIVQSIVQRASKFPNLKKELVASHSSLILQIFMEIHPEDEWVLSMIECLAVLMKYMPVIWMAHKADLEEHLFNMVDSVVFDVDEPIVECFVQLIAVPEKGVSPSDFPKRWKEHVQKILNGLHICLNTLFYELVDTEEVDQSAAFLPMLRPFPNKGSMFICASRRFQVLCCCLCKLLNTHTQTVSIPITRILHVVKRALEVSASYLVSKYKYLAQTAFEVLTILPNIHCSAFLVLESVVSCCSPALMIEMSSIWKLLFHCLIRDKAHRNVTDGVGYQCSQVRSTIYRVITTCIEKTLSSAFMPYVDQFLTEVFADISFVSSQNENMSSPFASTSNPGQSYFRTTTQKNLKHTSKVCTKALSALCSILYCKHKYTVLSTNHIESLQEKIVQLLMEIHQGVVSVQPYENPNCRLKLYDVLRHVILYMPYLSVLGVAMHIFLTGQQDCISEVSTMCHEGYALCIAIANPQRVIPGSSFAKQTATPELPSEQLNQVPVVDLPSQSVPQQVDNELKILVTNPVGNVDLFQQSPNVSQPPHSELYESPNEPSPVAVPLDVHPDVKISYEINGDILEKPENQDMQVNKVAEVIELDYGQDKEECEEDDDEEEEEEFEGSEDSDEVFLEAQEDGMEQETTPRRDERSSEEEPEEAEQRVKNDWNSDEDEEEASMDDEDLDSTPTKIWEADGYCNVATTTNGTRSSLSDEEEDGSYDLMLEPCPMKRIKLANNHALEETSQNYVPNSEMDGQDGQMKTSVVEMLGDFKEDSPDNSTS